METVHREVLDVHQERLVTSLRANDVIDRLLKEKAINKYDYDQLKRTEAQGSRAMNRLLVLTLQRRGRAAFPAFQQSLLDSQQRDLHDLLHTYEQGLTQAVLTDRLRRSHDLPSSCLPLNKELSGASTNQFPALPLHPTDLSHIPPSQPHSNHRRLLPEADVALYRQTSQAAGSGSPHSPSPVSAPVLQKASSPVLKGAPTPRKSSGSSLSRSPAGKDDQSIPAKDEQTTTKDSQSTPAKEQSALTRDNHSTPALSAREEEQETERQVRKLEAEVSELRQSYGKMESELRRQIEQLQRERGQTDQQQQPQAKKKKEGGCVVM